MAGAGTSAASTPRSGVKTKPPAGAGLALPSSAPSRSRTRTSRGSLAKTAASVARTRVRGDAGTLIARASSGRPCSRKAAASNSGKSGAPTRRRSSTSRRHAVVPLFGERALEQQPERVVGEIARGDPRQDAASVVVGERLDHRQPGQRAAPAADRSGQLVEPRARGRPLGGGDVAANERELGAALLGADRDPARDRSRRRQ